MRNNLHWAVFAARQRKARGIVPLEGFYPGAAHPKASPPLLDFPSQR